MAIVTKVSKHPGATRTEKSGDAKLRAMRESSSSPSSGESPQEYREKAINQSSEETAARQLITGTGEYDRTQIALNEINQRKQQQQVDALKARYQPAGGLMESFIQQQQQQQQVDALKDRYQLGGGLLESFRNQRETVNHQQLINPHLLGSDVTARTSITSQPSTPVRQVAPDTILPTQRISFESELSNAIDITVSRGQEKTTDVKVSPWSQNRMQQGIDISTKLENRAVEIKESNVGPVPAISPYLLKSLGGVAEMAFRVPAGVEVFSQKPTLLPEAVALGIFGTAHSAVSDPVQFASDTFVFSTLGRGVAGAGKKAQIHEIKAPDISTYLKEFMRDETAAAIPKKKGTLQQQAYKNLYDPKATVSPILESYINPQYQKIVMGETKTALKERQSLRMMLKEQANKPTQVQFIDARTVVKDPLIGSIEAQLKAKNQLTDLDAQLKLRQTNKPTLDMKESIITSVQPQKSLIMPLITLPESIQKQAEMKIPLNMQIPFQESLQSMPELQIAQPIPITITTPTSIAVSKTIFDVATITDPISPRTRYLTKVAPPIIFPGIDIDLGTGKKSLFDINVGIKKGSRKNKFGDVNRILFGR